MSDHAAPPTSTVKEMAGDIRESMRGSLSGVSRVRRGISLRPILPCIDCDNGKVVCDVCKGTGKATVVWNDEVTPCAVCGGVGSRKCSVCDGRGFVVNTHRKKVLWLLILGFVGWGAAAYMIWGGDLFPESRAKLFKSGGGQVNMSSGNLRRPDRTSVDREGNRVQRYSAPGGGGMMIQPGSGTQPR
jgi:hypothetical protein